MRVRARRFTWERGSGRAVFSAAGRRAVRRPAIPSLQCGAPFRANAPAPRRSDGAVDGSVTAIIAKRKPDLDAAPRADAAQVAGREPDQAPLPIVQSDGAGPVHGLRPGRWSMDVLFYLAGYAAITAAVLSFFGVW